MGNLMNSTILISVVAVILIVGIGVVMGTLYRRASRDQAYVRTGLGGRKVVLDGGALILPIFHSFSYVSLNTLRLEVKRSEQESMITKDRMRADITAEFYVRVKPDEENIALAAQTLGERTNDADELRNLVEAKFVDGLRSVAARMTLRELQEQRSEFVKGVQEAVAHDLQSNGLELESVSLTRLDQTDIKHFNPNNSFDAEGLTALTQITEDRRRERNEIQRDNEVRIATKDRDATLLRLTIKREEKDAELSQERDIANKTAETRAEAAKAEQLARQAEETARLDAEQAIAEREAQTRQARETSRIEADIAVAERSEQESQAKARAREAEALAIKAEERVVTARAVEIAERDKAIAVIDAEKDARRNATEITVKAAAEREAAEDRAKALTIEATARANAAETEAKGIKALGEANAEAESKLNAARNSLSSAVIDFELGKARIAIVPEALAQAMKPIEKISEIKIFSAGGLHAALGADGRPAGGNGASGPIGELSGQLMGMRGQIPIVDAVLGAAGFKGEDPVSAMLSTVSSKGAPTPVAEPAPAKPETPPAA